MNEGGRGEAADGRDKAGRADLQENKTRHSEPLPLRVWASGRNDTSFRSGWSRRRLHGQLHFALSFVIGCMDSSSKSSSTRGPTPDDDDASQSSSSGTQRPNWTRTTGRGNLCRESPQRARDRMTQQREVELEGTSAGREGEWMFAEVSFEASALSTRARKSRRRIFLFSVQMCEEPSRRTRARRHQRHREH